MSKKTREISKKEAARRAEQGTLTVPAPEMWSCPHGHASIGPPNSISVTGYGPPAAYVFCWMCAGQFLSRAFPTFKV